LNKKQVMAVMAILMIIVFYGGFRYGQVKSNTESNIIDLVKPADGSSSSHISNEKGLIQDANTDRKGEVDRKAIKVHVVGAVMNPGLYQLLEGDRVYDGVMLAGPTAEANLNALNLAEIVLDGGKITVPKQGETVAGAATAALSGGVEYPASIQGSAGQTGKVNINTADEQELDSRLPGVGPVLAKRIVDYRTANGHFQSPQDLTKVSGIGPKTYENLKDLIIVR
jgi:competence protein ComEA